MRQFVLAAILVLALATPSLALRLVGTGQSDSGGSIILIVRGRFIGALFRGQITCRPGSPRCLFRQGRVSATFFADGSFTGSVRAGRTVCDLAGLVLDASTLGGRYACVRGGLFDEGDFVVGAG